jgi:UDP-N-acetylmuramate--alanine ligase
MVQRDDLLDLVIKEQNQFDVVLMVGAGNIELLVEPVKQILDKKV